MRLDFYYWAAMCPLNMEMLALLQAYSSRLEIHTYDISRQPDLAGRLRMFYPTLSVVNHRQRYFAPLRREFLERLCQGNSPRQVPYRPALGRTPVAGTVLPITAENLDLAGSCTGVRWLPGMEAEGGVFGGHGTFCLWFSAYAGKRLLGGAEYVPSMQVPYAIPRDARKAFLTCVYLSDEAFDYKTTPLNALEAYLGERYESALVISDETGVFPNGDLTFFLLRGYQDLGVVAREGTYCTLHLLEKQLRT